MPRNQHSPARAPYAVRIEHGSLGDDGWHVTWDTFTNKREALRFLRQAERDGLDPIFINRKDQQQ